MTSKLVRRIVLDRRWEERSTEKYLLSIGSSWMMQRLSTHRKRIPSDKATSIASCNVLPREETLIEIMCCFIVVFFVFIERSPPQQYESAAYEYLLSRNFSS